MTTFSVIDYKKRSGHTFWIFSYFIQTFFSSSLYVVALLVFKIRGMSWKGEQLIAHWCICMLQHWSEDVSCSSSVWQQGAVWAQGWTEGQLDWQFKAAGRDPFSCVIWSVTLKGSNVCLTFSFPFHILRIKGVS